MSEIDDIERKTRYRKATDKYNCDFSTGWRTDSTGAPHIVMCGNHPVKFMPEFSPFGLYACEQHIFDTLAKMREER